jgi:hypothetical protein
MSRNKKMVMWRGDGIWPKKKRRRKKSRVMGKIRN